MYTEDELLPLSALRHLAFCERQCALVLVEQQWVENRYTAEGRVLHERTDAGGGETRSGVRIARSLPLRCRRLGLVGVADVVELTETEEGAVLGAFPVEYKRGRPKRWPGIDSPTIERAEEIQLCGQALCLEEMLEIEVPRGALFYGKRKRRTEVVFDTELRRLTEAAARRLHQLVAEGFTPPPVDDARCTACAQRPICVPTLRARSARTWLDGALASALGGRSAGHSDRGGPSGREDDG